MPLASHSLGYMLMRVKPGMVLISFKNSSPLSPSSKKVDARQPGTVQRAEGA